MELVMFKYRARGGEGGGGDDHDGRQATIVQ